MVSKAFLNSLDLQVSMAQIVRQIHSILGGLFLYLFLVIVIEVDHCSVYLSHVSLFNVLLNNYFLLVIIPFSDKLSQKKEEIYLLKSEGNKRKCYESAHHFRIWGRPNR